MQFLIFDTLFAIVGYGILIWKKETWIAAAVFFIHWSINTRIRRMNEKRRSR